MEPPTFSPPSTHFGDTDWKPGEYISVPSHGASGAGGGSGTPAVVQGGQDSGSRVGAQPHPYSGASEGASPGLSSASADSRRPVAMDIDGLTTLPERPGPTPQPGPNTPLPRSDAPPGQPVVGPPVLQNSGGGTNNPASGRMPVVPRPPLPLHKGRAQEVSESHRCATAELWAGSPLRRRPAVLPGVSPAERSSVGRALKVVPPWSAASLPAFPVVLAAADREARSAAGALPPRQVG